MSLKKTYNFLKIGLLISLISPIKVHSSEEFYSALGENTCWYMKKTDMSPLQAWQLAMNPKMLLADQRGVTPLKIINNGVLIESEIKKGTIKNTLMAMYKSLLQVKKQCYFRVDDKTKFSSDLAEAKKESTNPKYNVEPPKPPWVSKLNNEFHGSISIDNNYYVENDSTLYPIKTKFKYLGKEPFQGSFNYIKSGSLVEGIIEKCRSHRKRERYLICNLKDKDTGNYGDIAFQFSENLNSFEGYWTASWNSDKQPWSGDIDPTKINVAKQKYEELTFKGGKYNGYTLNGKLHGKGTFSWKNGSKYTGDWLNNKIHGQGTLIESNGNKYSGNFVYDNKEGQGTYTFSNGTEYTGAFTQNSMNGEGKLSIPGQGSLEGYFKNGKLNGRIIITSTNGERKVCTYKNNQIVSYIPCEALSN